MDQLRQDPLSGRWVVVAPGRALRPAAFPPQAPPSPAAASCPFCPGHERDTPPEVWADREAGTAPDTPGWRVRVVPNLFPALTLGAPDPPPAPPPYRSAPATGVQEVIVHGPDHHATLADQPVVAAGRVLGAWQARLAAWRRPPIGALLVVVNQGQAAGASLTHPHSQVVAMAERPEGVAVELPRLRGEGCQACALLATEREGPRLVAERDGIVVLCPWASAMPYEALLLPAGHQARFEEATVPPGATALRGLLRGLATATTPHTPYNLVLHTAPPDVDDFHWHLHLLPRLTTYGGVELGTGVVLNVVDPDRAARSIRGGARAGSPPETPPAGTSAGHSGCG